MQCSLNFFYSGKFLFVIDKLRVAGFMDLCTEALAEAFMFRNSATRSLSSLSYCSFVSHKDRPSLVTLKKLESVVTRLNWKGKINSSVVWDFANRESHYKPSLLLMKLGSSSA